MPERRYWLQLHGSDCREQSRCNASEKERQRGCCQCHGIRKRKRKEHMRKDARYGDCARKPYANPDQRYQCSVTAGTIFHKTRTPLSSWFWAIYRMSHDKKGISAMQLAKEIGVSYPTAWLMLHKIRKAMSDRDQGYRLSPPEAEGL